MNCRDDLSVNPFSDKENFENQINFAQINLLLKGLHECRSNGLYTDIVLCANEEEFHCHKVILAATSRYFNAMFMTPFSEQQTSRVYLKQVSAWALKQLLDFSYSGCLNLTTITMQDIFVTANLLDYPLAVQSCIEFMKNHLDISNCLGVQMLADAYGFPDLSEKARSIAVENFTRLINESSEWLSLPAEYVASYLQSDHIDVPSEKFVLNACLNWISNDLDKRQHHLLSLLPLIRLHELSTQSLKDIMTSHLALRDCSDALTYINNVVKQKQVLAILKPQFNNPVSSPANEVAFLPPRPSTIRRKTLVAVGGINSSILNSMDTFSLSKKRWTSFENLPVHSLTWFSAHVVSNTLIVTGGIQAGSIVSTVYRYLVGDNSWVVGSKMPQSRARHSSVSVLGTHLFVFGGITLISNNHSTIQPSSENNSNNANNNSHESLFQLNETIVPDVSLVNTIVSYDLNLDQWTNIGMSRIPRQMSSLAIISNTRFHSPDNRDNGFKPTYPEDSSSEEFIIVELGGTLDTQSLMISDKIAIYRVSSDLRVEASDDYIKLMQPVMYTKCATDRHNRLVYILWEMSGEISVLDFYRQSLRNLTYLNRSSCTDAESPVQEPRVHCGFVEIDNCLYVLGGFSQLIGATNHPTAARASLHRYDIDNNIWSLVSSEEENCVPRAVFGCVSLEM